MTVIKDNLHAKEVIIGDGEMRKRYILCFNPEEAIDDLIHSAGHKCTTFFLKLFNWVMQNSKISTKYSTEYRLMRSYMKSFSISPNGRSSSVVRDIT